MRNLLLGTLLLSLAAFAEERPPSELDRGVSLYEAGKYDEAMAVFQALLAADPADDAAAYELAMTYQAKQDFAKCRAIIEPRVFRKGRLQPMMYTVLGNCLDMAGESKRAIDAYRKGLRIAPNDPQLLFNLAVALAGQKKIDEARELLKKEVVAAPFHGSGHYFLAQIFDSQGFRAAAAVQYLRFLSIEASGERARAGATRMLELLNLGVEETGPGKTKITIDPDSRKEEGDYASFEMMLAITGVAGRRGEKAELTEFDRTREQIVTSLTILTEGGSKGKDYTARNNIPFFASLIEQKMLDTAAGLAISSLDLPGTAAWKQANTAAIQAYVAWMNAQRRR
ncbi:MAG TPA: tetratricopeptide repeat protein [Thermoanaerobaculia bacterium]|nr:tetratricopeptide repeat protein [Thermoanaerobaculia bacterium]